MEHNAYLEAARAGKNGFLRYLLITILVVAAMLFVSTILLVAFFFIEGVQRLEDLSLNSTLVLSMLPFLFAALVLLGGLMLVHQRRPRSLTHPAGPFRWSSVFVSAGVWLLLAAVSDVIMYLIDPGRYSWSFNPAQFFPFLALALVLVPIQTTAEELFFRGYLTQGVGLLARGSTLLALIIPSFLFGMLHFWNPEVQQYGAVWLMPQYIGMGLLLGYITLRSKGMELAIGLHAANNLYSAVFVTFRESAIPSPALFTMNIYDPKLSLLMLAIFIALYLLLISAWKGGKLWRLAGVVTALSLFLSACVPAPAPSFAFGLPLEDCRLAAPGVPLRVSARCGTVEVFENREAASGRKIGLKVAILPATSQSRAEDPLFLLAGGPGQASTEAFVPLLNALDRVRFNRDIVMVDQRGTGSSHPLECPQVEGDALESDAPEEEQVRQLRVCLDNLDADPSLYTTDIAMQDLDEVRAVLGYEKINLLGVSYGTRAALMYLQLFPERVRSLVLDSVVPLGWNLGEWGARDAQRAFEVNIVRCQADAACRAAFPDTGAAFNKVLDQLEAQPVEVTLPDPTTGEEITVKLTRSVAALTVRLMMYSTEYTALLPLIIDQAAKGDWKPLASQHVVNARSLDESMTDGMYMSVLCSEDVPFYTQDAGGGSAYFSFDIKAIQEQCAVWPHKVQPETLRGPVRSNVPTLLLAGSADPVTPPVYAEQVAQDLPNSRVVVLEGMGHNVMYRGCLPRLINDFLKSGSVEGLGLSCTEKVQPDPFFLNFSGPQP